MESCVIESTRIPTRPEESNKILLNGAPYPRAHPIVHQGLRHRRRRRERVPLNPGRRVIPSKNLGKLNFIFIVYFNINLGYVDHVSKIRGIFSYSFQLYQL